MPELLSPPRRGGGTFGLRAGSRREGEKDSPRPRHFLRVNLRWRFTKLGRTPDGSLTDPN